MEHAQAFPAKRVFLYSLVISIALTALLGIGVILSGQWGWFEIRVLLTTITIGGASICGLANAAYLSTGRAWAFPLIGVGISLVSGLMIICGMWSEWDSIELWKLSASLSVFSVAFAHLSLLSMAKLVGWFQWSLVVAYFTILGVASLMVLMIVWETSNIGMFQFMGVAAIFDAAITILIPIFHKLSYLEEEKKGSFAVDATGIAIDREIASLKERIAELEQKKRELMQGGIV